MPLAVLEVTNIYPETPKLITKLTGNAEEMLWLINAWSRKAFIYRMPQVSLNQPKRKEHPCRIQIFIWKAIWEVEGEYAYVPVRILAFSKSILCWCSNCSRPELHWNPHAMKHLIFWPENSSLTSPVNTQKLQDVCVLLFFKHLSQLLKCSGPFSQNCADREWPRQNLCNSCFVGWCWAPWCQPSTCHAISDRGNYI